MVGWSACKESRRCGHGAWYVLSILRPAPAVHRLVDGCIRILALPVLVPLPAAVLAVRVHVTRVCGALAIGRPRVAFLCRVTSSGIRILTVGCPRRVDAQEERDELSHWSARPCHLTLPEVRARILGRLGFSY